jgi:hypothetical protein
VQNQNLKLKAFGFSLWFLALHFTLCACFIVSHSPIFERAIDSIVLVFGYGIIIARDKNNTKK